MRRTPCLLVVGTGTGVGKTELAALLVETLRTQGVDVAVLKPLASGCRRVRGRLVSDDALRLAGALGLRGEARRSAHDAIAPWRAARPLAPALALPHPPSTRKLVTCVEATARGRGAIVVEAAGGLLVPYTEDGTVLDVARALAGSGALAVSVVLVGASALGTINHTCLSIAALRAAGVPPVAVVLSRTRQRRTPDERGNVAAIARIAGVEAPLTLPFLTARRGRQRSRLTGPSPSVRVPALVVERACRS
ncbi:MAG: dethiobiotin synthase [Deltaproteobacteria bacterium]|nr:dethiobiotin synthase [Deltaproteobacteria bacterium]